MTSIIFIIAGILIGGWAAKNGALVPIESQKAIIFQGTLGGIIQFLCQFGGLGLGLVIYGIVGLFA